jgi:murein L,D-transpeptidase YafK
LDYPNEWDQQQGRKGHGIWIHGTPLDTYSRPPRASNGCVVLANEDLRTLEPVLATGKTRVLVTDSVQWAPNAEVENLRKSVAGALESWRSDWSTNDMDKYLSHYSDEFRIGKIDLETWERDKRRVAAGKKWIKVTTNDISIFLVPGQTDLAVVDFDQDYKSSNLENHMRKRQYWQRESDGWKILFEGTPKS